jgi:aminoglycoside 2'-N-acetyltransferase I
VTQLRVLTTGEATTALLGAIRHMLDDAFDGAFTEDDWDHALGGWHVVVTDGADVVSHAAVVTRVLEVAGRPFHTGYVEAVATATARQSEGLGSRAMATATDVVRCEFELGALSTGSHHFYERLGWERWRGPTYVRCGEHAVRTPDEDDGVMVLRFGASAGIDLRAPVSCDARIGDDW